MIPSSESADELRRECHLLIESLYRSKLNIKLLTAAKKALKMFVSYKANRQIDFSKRGQKL